KPIPGLLQQAVFLDILIPVADIMAVRQNMSEFPMPMLGLLLYLTGWILMMLYFLQMLFLQDIRLQKWEGSNRVIRLWFLEQGLLVSWLQNVHGYLGQVE